MPVVVSVLTELRDNILTNMSHWCFTRDMNIKKICKFVCFYKRYKDFTVNNFVWRKDIHYTVGRITINEQFISYERSTSNKVNYCQNKNEYSETDSNCASRDWWKVKEIVKKLKTTFDNYFPTYLSDRPERLQEGRRSGL